MTFEDREISGASIVNRLGFLSLIRAAKARLFDVIVAKGLDRLFRDQADYHTAAQAVSISWASPSTKARPRSCGGFFPNLSKAGRRGQLPRRSMPIGVKAPRGARWNASTVNGNTARGHGRLYASRIVWNKVRMIKDP